MSRLMSIDLNNKIVIVRNRKCRKSDVVVRFLSQEQMSFEVFYLGEDKKADELAKKYGILASPGIIINGILPKEVCQHPFFKSRFDMQQKHIIQIESKFPVKIRKMYQRDGEIKGIERLLNIEKDLFGNSEKQHYSIGSIMTDAAKFGEFNSDSVSEIIKPNGKTKAIFFTGKGGVGKTVVSVATAYHLASEGYKTLLLTTDPASHIGQVLEREVTDQIKPVEGVTNLWSVIVDQEKATAEYKQRILDESMSKYSEDMLLAIKEELESPCTEEMAAFDKFMTYVESDDYDFVVFDTAPTGHTLRLLELPFDYGDQVSLMVTTNQQSAEAKSVTQKRFDRVIARMKDPQRSIFAFVVYPESTPVIEAYRAMLDLKEAGIKTQFVVANQVLQPEYCTNEFFISRRFMQEKYLSEIRERFGLPLVLVPLFETEIKGIRLIQRTATEMFGRNTAATH